MNITVDILVIDVGGVGCRVVIAAADCGTSVLLASEKSLGEPGATSHPVAEMAGYNAGDVSILMDVQMHYNDIIEVGQGTADEGLAAIAASRALETIRQLEEWGVKLEHENEGYYAFRSCFPHYPRTHAIKGYGEPVVRVMKDQIYTRPNITVMDDATIMGLYVRDGCCVGVCGLAGREMVYISPKAVILASGGCGQVFERNTNPSDVIGGGYSTAYHAGADPVNMELMQIGMGFSRPVVNIFNGYIWETKPRPPGREGKDIFEEVLPQNPTSDQAMHEYRKHFPPPSSNDSEYPEVAIQTAVEDGRGTQRGGIRADLPHITDEYVNSLEDDCGTHHMWPIARGYLRSRDVGLLLGQVEVACYVHTINGGVRINTKGMSSTQGLYVAGECAGGPHGVDRLGGSMMVTCQVFGEIAGANAVECALRIQHAEHMEYFRDPHVEEMKALLHRKLDCMGMLNWLRRVVQDNPPVAWTENGLTQALNMAKELGGEMVYIDTCQEIYSENIDLYHMLITVRTMARCVLERRESRGSHHRTDHSFKDERFNKPVTIRKNG